MKIELKVYDDSGKLLQTLTAAPQEITLDTEYEPARTLDFRKIIRSESPEIKSLTIKLEKLIKSSEGIVYQVETHQEKEKT